MKGLVFLGSTKLGSGFLRVWVRVRVRFVNDAEITATNFYVPVGTLLTQDNAKPLEEKECAFKRPINWDKYQSKK